MNLFELAAVLTLNKSNYDKGIKDAEKTAESIGAKIGNGLKAVGKITTAVVGAGATAVGALVKQSVQAYGEYEQLVGGAQLMFGDAYDTVAEYAKNAYKTVQLSSSEYLTQVNGFATGLKTSLDGDAQAAAELANKIVKAEADVIAATGRPAEAVQNAFNGIMRSNFTMLDNLQLGITPTKEGMSDLIDQVNAWKKANGEAANYEMGNLADMQAALVDYIEMQGLAGYAGKEAGDTITGSLSSVKAAWQNLVTGIADDNADIGGLIEAVLSQAVGALNNLIPIIKRVLGNVAPLIKQALPPLIDLAVSLITDNLPDLVDAAIQLVTGLGEAIGDNADKLIDAAMSIIDSLVGYMTAPDGLSKMIDVAIDIILKLADGLIKAVPELLPAVTNVILAIVGKLTEPDTIDLLITAGIDLIMALIDGLIGAQDVLIEQAPIIVGNLVEGIIKAAVRLVFAAGEIVTQLVGGIAQKWNKIINVGHDAVKKFGEGIKDKWEDAKNWGKNLIDGFVQGILEKWERLKSSVQGIVDGVKRIFTGKQGLNEQSPSKWGKQVFEYLMEGAEEGLDAGAPSLFRTTKGVVAGVQDEFDNSYSPSVTVSGSGNGSIYALLMQYLPLLSQMKVYLDTGALVGGLTPGIDAALGRRAAAAGRGVTL